MCCLFLLGSAYNKCLYRRIVGSCPLLHWKMIDVKTFERYLKELRDKYPAGTKIRSNTNRLIDGQELHGRQILEIPASNKTFDKIKEYEALAKDKYGIELRYREE